MISIHKKEDCCGCTACANVCPKKCIVMEPDEEGFLYPQVKKDLCIDCGLCEKVCPVKFPPIKKSDEYKDEQLDAVVARTKSKDFLRASTSGGFVNELNLYTLSREGYVCGCVFDTDFLTKHYITNNKEEFIRFCGSKYVQSNLSDCFTKIKGFFYYFVQLCFTGTPCQVAGLKTFLRKEYDNLITVDLVCRSIPGSSLYKKYLQFQEAKYKSKIKKINFRNKTYGYHSGSLTIEFENGKKYSGSNRVDLYMKAFHSDIASRPSCYECKFKTKKRCSDFTVFDSWRPDRVALLPCKDDDNGYTNVILHSEKAKHIIQQLSNLEIYSADADKMFLYAGGMESNSIIKTEKRDKFFRGLQDVSKENFSEYIKSFVSITKKDIIIEKSKSFLYKTGLLRLINKHK